MNELFIVYDYETHKPIYFFLTNKAKECENIFGDIEKEIIDNDNLYSYDIVDLFIDECKKQNITLEQVYCEGESEY